MRSVVFKLAVLCLLAAGPAQSDTVDFTQLPAGNQGSGPVAVDGVTFQGTQSIFNTSNSHFAGTGGSICSFDPAAFNCANDLTVTFNGAVKRLRLATAGFNAGDSVTISAFRGNRLLATTEVVAAGAIRLRSLGKVTRLVIVDNSTGTVGAGFAYGKFKFKRPAVAAKDQTARKPRRAAAP